MNEWGAALNRWIDDNLDAIGFVILMICGVAVVVLILVVIVAVILVLGGDSPQYFDHCHRAEVWINKDWQIVWSCTGSR